MDTKLRLKDVANLTRNSANGQFSLNLRAKKLKELGLTHHKLLNMELRAR